MNIRIEEINIQGLGPLNEFNGKMGNVNLIYGRNEQGKTYLVEFLVKSLFKNTNGFNLRALEPVGRVLISGLGENQEVFSPKAPKKLEDYLLKDYPGMPANIGRLLVVKGAELNFDDRQSGGVSKSIIKSFLTSVSTLDSIQNKIQKTVKLASVENGIIQGNKQGEIKARLELISKLEQLDQLHEKVNQKYSKGSLTELKRNSKLIKEKISKQQNAKKYLAFKTWNKIQKIKNNLQGVDEIILEKLRDDFKNWSKSKDDIKEKNEQYQKVSKEAEHYPWLETAVVEYQNLLSKGGVSLNNNSLYVGGVFVGIGLLFGVVGGIISIVADTIIGFGVTTIGMLCVLCGAGFWGYYLQHTRRKSKSVIESEEMSKIRKTFQEKIGIPFNDFATLKEYQKSQSQSYASALAKKEDIENIKKEIRELEFNIIDGLEKFKLETEDSDSWGDSIRQLETIVRNLKKELNETEIKFASLGIEESEFVTDNPGVDFDKNILMQLEQENSEVNSNFTSLETELEKLKFEIQTLINDSSTSWDVLLDKLRLERIQVACEYQSLTSKILAGILINQVVEEIRAKEDEKILEQLKSPIIMKPLSKITSHYKYLRFNGEDILVGDDYQEFEISDLSTGSREQVLLALRLGFAMSLVGGNPAFFVFDDAFQHSDWIRREQMMEQIVNLTKQGWQIIYLTMDDHIRGLFQELGKKEFGNNYQEFIL